MNVRLPDFDMLAALHRQDPAALDIFRKQLLRDAVDAAPAAHRPSLEQLLVRIEEARSSASTPVEAAASAFRMMCESVERLHEGWEQALQSLAELQAAVLIERLRHQSGFGTAA